VARGVSVTRSGSGVFWLPSYHDMGLIGGILQPLYIGRPTVLLSPIPPVTSVRYFAPPDVNPVTGAPIGRPSWTTNSRAMTDLFAPGALITSDWLGGGAVTGTGTSFASPQSAGCAADLLLR
jgi:subtilisin family serine protease